MWHWIVLSLSFHLHLQYYITVSHSCNTEVVTVYINCKMNMPVKLFVLVLLFGLINLVSDEREILG